MQVLSGPIGRPKVHYVAPAASRLDAGMERFLGWFESNQQKDPLLKTAIAHLWFVTIHPFEDGNGRIARAIAEMCLAGSDGSAQRFYSMSSQILEERKNYYEILEKTQKQSEPSRLVRPTGMFKNGSWHSLLLKIQLQPKIPV